MSRDEQEARRVVVAVCGAASGITPDAVAACERLGAELVEAGFRVVTGGLGGVMSAVSKGARRSSAWQEGRVIGILPGYDAEAANPYVDIAIPTGMQLGRNVLVVSMADVVVAVAGGSGTLSEIAMAWQLGKPVVALTTAGDWAEALAGQVLDHRQAAPIKAATSVDDVIRLVKEAALRTSRRPGDIGSGWRRDP